MVSGQADRRVDCPLLSHQPLLCYDTLMEQENKNIPKMPFGNTGHLSTRVIFGAAALATVSQEEADRTMELINEYGINHIDTARSYGEAEVRLGPWMQHARDSYFLASKTGERTREGAWRELNESLERLQSDHIDLWQMHCLVEEDEWQTAMGPGGVLEAAVEAKEQGLISSIGVTGHGIQTARMHIRSLRHFPFDSVLLPYNYMMMQDRNYARDMTELLNLCEQRNVAVQTIKSLARRVRTPQDTTYTTWYAPLSSEEAITESVAWVLSAPGIFLNTVGDTTLLPLVLKAAASGKTCPDEDLENLVQREGIEQLFTEANRDMKI